jgi:hypothetical protein
LRRFAEPSHHQSEIQISSFFASIVARQPINQRWHGILRQMIQKLRHRVNPLFACRTTSDSNAFSALRDRRRFVYEL